MKKWLTLLLLALIAGGAVYLLRHRSPSAATSDGSVERVRRAGELTIAADFSTYPWAAFNQTTGAVDGAEPEVGAQLARDLGVAAHFVDAGNPSQLVEAGRADLAFLRPGSASSDKLALSTPYFADGLAIVTRADSKVVKLSELSGLKVAVTTAVCCGGSDLVKSNGSTGVTFADDQGAYKALEKGEVGAGLLEMSESAWYVRNHPLLKLVGGDADHFVAGGGAFTIAVASADRTLLGAINSDLAAASGNGALKAIMERWYLFKES